MNGSNRKGKGHVLVATSGAGKSYLLKTAATQAQGEGRRVVVLDYGRTWLPFAATFDGASYVAESDFCATWPGGTSFNGAYLAGFNRPLVIDLERAPEAPSATFGQICDFLKSDAYPHLIVVEESFYVGRYQQYVAPFFQACGDAEVLASAQSASDADWLKAFCPELTSVLLDSRNRSFQVDASAGLEKLTPILNAWTSTAIKDRELSALRSVAQ